MKKLFIVALGAIMLGATAYGQPLTVDKDEFLALQQEIVDNAVIVQRKGPEWAAQYAKVQRLQMLLNQAQTISTEQETEINAIVAQQRFLQQKAMKMLQNLSTTMTPEEFAKFQQTHVMPVAMQMEINKGLAIEFVEELMEQNSTFQEFPELLTVDGHISVSKYEAKILNDYIQENELDK